MAARGHQVSVVAASDDTRQSSDENDGGVRVLRLNGGDFWVREAEPGRSLLKLRTLYRYHSYRKKIRRVVASLKDVDLIEVADFGSEGEYLFDLNVPVVVRLHTPSLFDRNTLGIARNQGLKHIYDSQGKHEWKQMLRADYLTSCSQSLKDWTVKNIGVDENKIKVIFNPVNVSLSTQVEKKVVAPKTILFAGTISDVKGCGDLYEAGQLLRKQETEDFSMELYGKTGIWSEQLSEQSKQDNSWFHVCGKVSREELQAKYASATVVCFPSWWDNMPMVCIEAMLQGAIVLASSSGGMSEIIADGIDGFLLPPHEPRLWADKLYELLHMEESERKSISTNAIKRIREDFSTEAICSQMTTYYEQVIKDYKQK